MDVDHDEHDGVASRDAGRRPAADQTEEEEEEFPPNPNNANLKFRNYVPKDKSLRKHHILPAPPDVVSEMEEHFLPELSKVDDEELLREASKESNWDLKRELSDKTSVLDAATQVALSQLLRMKIGSK